MTLNNKALAELQKNYSGILTSGSIPRLNRISTGLPNVDWAMGGGIPLGRITQIYASSSSGKTTLALQCIKAAQNDGLTCAIIDMEKTIDSDRLQQLGINEEHLLFAQPDTGDDALALIEELSKAGVSLIVLDSVAACMPRVMMDTESSEYANKQFIGNQARMFAMWMSRIQTTLNRNQSALIMLNQTRVKIQTFGYGCLHGETKVNLVDGRSLPIRKIVKDKIKGEVYCLNETTNEIEIKPIIGWHHNGYVNLREDFIHFKSDCINNLNGHFNFTVTPNHKVYCNNKWIEAKDIQLGDKLTSKYTEIINGTLKDFLYGSFIGDSHIKEVNQNHYIKFQDNENLNYVRWKISKLNKLINFKEQQRSNGVIYYVSEPLYELKNTKFNLGKRNPLFMLVNNFNWLSFAIWFMDDGHYHKPSDISKYGHFTLSIERFKNEPEIVEKILFYINQSIQGECKINKGLLRFNKEATHYIANHIKSYVPESMQYKLPEQYQGFYIDFELTNKSVIKIDYVTIKEKRFASERQMRQKSKYDLSIKDNFNYMVGGLSNGVIVHNSPVTLPGGTSVTFYSSIILKLSTKYSGKVPGEGDMEVVTTKNKTAVNSRKVTVKVTTNGLDVQHSEMEVLVNADFKVFRIESGGMYHLSSELLSSSYIDEYLSDIDMTKAYARGRQACIDKLNTMPDFKQACLKFIQNYMSDVAVESASVPVDQLDIIDE
jgi:recombination protein RecA